MARQTFYDVIGVPDHATEQEIAAAVRERLATTWGDERELVINAANTLLNRESRESYNRLNGITRVRQQSDIRSDNQVELAKYEEAERLRRAESAFAELKWTLNFLALGVGIGVWLLLLFQFIPVITTELDKILLSSRAFNPLFAGIALTIPSFIIVYFAMHLFSEELNIVFRYMLVCLLLGGLLWGAGRSILASNLIWWVRLLTIMGIFLGTLMFARYLGIRQVRTLGADRPMKSRRRDQH